MKEDTEPKETTSRREITKAAVIAAVAAPIAAVLASCTNQPLQGGQATPSASPAPTRPRLEGGDSPIIVGGGGSVIIDFSESDYEPKPNAANPDHYEVARALQRIFYIDRKGMLQKTQSITGTTKIEFDVRDPANVLKKITIDSDAAAPKTVITFALADYPRDPTVGDRHFHTQRKLKKLTINATDNTVLDEKGTILIF